MDDAADVVIVESDTPDGKFSRIIIGVLLYNNSEFMDFIFLAEPETADVKKELINSAPEVELEPASKPEVKLNNVPAENNDSKVIFELN